MEENKSRVYHSLKNARVSLFFTLIAIFIGFFSRKVFLDRLGVEFMGLSGTLQSLLGFLNIAELGIGTAVSYSLYKPLADGDRDKINDIVSVLGYLYSRVGYFIFGAGVILSCFLPLIFPKTGMPMLLIYCGYYTYIISSLFSYFLNYRMTLLSADQRNYVVTRNLQMCSITQLLLQMAAAKYCANLYLFFAISLVFSGIYSLILNRKINAHYSWLNSTVANGREKLKAFPEIKQKIKQIFIHKIGGVFQSQITNVIVYAVVSLKDVALLGNYMSVTSKALLLCDCCLGGTWASVGNVVANGDKNKTFRIYEELVALRCIIAGGVVFSIYHLLEVFIALWIGRQYVMAHDVLVFLVLDVYLTLTRSANDQFVNAYGLFFDTWVPLVELILVVLFGFTIGVCWGIAGVVLSLFLSKLFTAIFWKPFLLFKYGFEMPLKYYLKIWIPVVVISALVLISGNYLIDLCQYRKPVNWLEFCIYGAIVTLTGCFLNAALVLTLLPGGKMLRNRLLMFIHNRLRML